MCLCAAPSSAVVVRAIAMTMHQWTLFRFAEERARTTSAVSAPGRGPDGNCGHIERFYNRRRLDQAMGYRSPEEFDQQEVELEATVPHSRTKLFLNVRRYPTDFRGSDRRFESCHNNMRKEMRSVDAGPISSPVTQKVGTRKPCEYY